MEGYYLIVLIYRSRKSVYRFINKLLKSTDSNDTDLDNLCLTLLNLEKVDEDRLEAWIEFAILRHLNKQDHEDGQQVVQPQQPTGSSTPLVVRSETTEEIDKSGALAGPSGKVNGPQDGISLLQNLTQFAFRKGEAETFAHALLKMLLKHLSPNSRGNITPELVLIMVKLAAVGQGSGHHDLFLAALDWLLKYQQVMSTESWTALNQEDLSDPPPEMASFCCLLQYTTDVLYALKVLSTSNVGGAASSTGAAAGDRPTNGMASDGLLEQIEGNLLAADVEDWVDELGLGEDVESDGDESDEDLLCNQL